MVCILCVLAWLPALFALVPATVSDSFRHLHCFDVTVWENFKLLVSVSLDLTLPAHFMSDGSGSHCRMMSESSRKFIIFTAHIVANMSVGPFISTTVDMRYSECSHIHAEHFQSTCACNIFQHEIVTLYHWEFAVFDDALCSLVWFRLCFAFDT